MVYLKKNVFFKFHYMFNPKFPLQDVLVDTHLLMKKSLQKGILQMRDKVDNTQRATKRVEILHGLLQNKYTGEKFTVNNIPLLSNSFCFGNAVLCCI